MAKRYAAVPVKQAVISPSALSLLYPAKEIPGYTRDAFIDDLLRGHETELRRCPQRCAHKVRNDFAPFCDDPTTTRETAFAKIRVRVQGSAMAERELTKR